MEKQLVQINYSNLSNNTPYEFIIHNWQMGEKYKNYYILFEASWEFDHGNRRFILCLPLFKVLRVLNRVSLRLKK